MVYKYKTQGVCSAEIDLEVSESGEIRDVRFKGGCNGNAKGVSALVKGRKATEVVGLLEGIKCESKKTSCPDQLSIALRQVLSKTKDQAG